MQASRGKVLALTFLPAASPVRGCNCIDQRRPEILPIPYAPARKWLITGGCGFIGTGLVKHLLTDGRNAVRVLDNLSVGTQEALFKVGAVREINARGAVPAPAPAAWGPVQLVVGDVRDDDLACRMAAEMDIIVHLAANTGVAPSVENPRNDMQANVIGTFNLLEAARHNKIARFILASSSAAVGEASPPIHEEMAAHPVSPYGASKLAGEAYCSAYHRAFGLETVALRFGNVYGPGSGHKSSVVAKFIRQAISGEPIEIYGDGHQTRDFIFIDDLIRAILAAARAPEAAGEVFQIATNREHTVNELAEHLLAALAAAGIGAPATVHRQRRAGDVRRSFSDTAKAGRLLGWQAKVGLAEGLKQTVDWFTTVTDQIDPALVQAPG